MRSDIDALAGKIDAIDAKLAAGGTVSSVDDIVLAAAKRIVQGYQ